jgi:hypothetical protein
MPLSDSASRSIRDMLGKITGIRRMDRKKGSILKAGADKTAPAEPEMLSQIGTIVKRIRAKTDPEGSRELGLASEKEAATLLMAPRAGRVVGAGGGPRLVKARNIKPYKPTEKVLSVGKAEPEVGLSQHEAGLFSKAMGSGPGGWEKLTMEQALAMLKSALLKSA